MSGEPGKKNNCAVTPRELSCLIVPLGGRWRLPDSITAITFVALGTSLPDTFASRTAAIEDPTADASVGNVTGSNSVNVFLGLGLPWIMSNAYWDWHRGTAFVVTGGSLVFSVQVYMVCAGACLCVLLLRRLHPAIAAELGGPTACSLLSGGLAARCCAPRPPWRAAAGGLRRTKYVGRSGALETTLVARVTKLLGQQARFVATDLLALAQEASSWGPELERAEAAHATVWRHLRQQPCRPEVFWVPAHQDVDGYLAAGLHPVLCAGNLWADWFAKQGALQHTVPQVSTEFYAIELQYSKQVADYIRWGVQRCLAIGDWAPEARCVPAAPPPPAPKLTAVECSLVRVQGTRGMLCTERGRRSRAEAGAAAQQSARWRISVRGHTGWATLKAWGPRRCSRATVAGPASWRRGRTLWLHEGDGRGVALRLGHRLRRAGPAIYCEICVARMQARAARGLQKARCGPPTDKGHHQRTCVSNLVARRDRLQRGLGPKTGKSWATGTLVHGERSSVDDSPEEGTDEAVAAQGSAEVPLADAQGTATRGSPAAPCGGRAEEAQMADAQETATRGAPAALRGGRAEEAPLAEVQGAAARGAPELPRGGRTEASRLLAEVVARRSVCAAPAPSWQERLEVLRRRVATRGAGPACVAAGGAGSVSKAQVVMALTDTGGSAAGLMPPPGRSLRALPQRPPRPLALERRLDRWGRWWIEPLLDADGAASGWLDRCAPYAEAVLAAFPPGDGQRGSAAGGGVAPPRLEPRSEAARRLRRASFGPHAEPAVRRRQHAEVRGVYCLRSWQAAPAGLLPALGWARAARRRPRPGAAAAPREGQGAQAVSQDRGGGEGSDVGEGRRRRRAALAAGRVRQTRRRGRLGGGLHGSGAVHLAQVGRRRGSGGDAVVVPFGLAIDLI
ncbi:unnamed protein product [Prorocentrum cordatum]|uniref:Sodium/calcium exchanger membrane region domain-containing protein n=1 Tax=Prorocentrum cordatum TaxID=2364126 RepID=A0ABN9QKR8_9DINO|nr:unnamed protein product [Polarella glacialis]